MKRIKNIMSFQDTKEAIALETQTLTYRNGWKDLEPGDRLRPIFRSQKKYKRLLPDNRCIEIVSAKEEPLSIISTEDCRKAGFPELTPFEYIELIILKKYKKLNRFSSMTVIEFKYVKVD